MAVRRKSDRPLSREAARAQQEHRKYQQEKRQESRELAQGPIDLPFCLLVLLLTAIGLVAARVPDPGRLARRSDAWPSARPGSPALTSPAQPPHLA